MADHYLKRDLTRAGIALAVAVVGYGVLALTGNTGKTAAPAATAAPAGTYIAGTYTASAKGISSDVTVELTFSDSALESAKIDVSGETPEIGGSIGEKMQDALVAAQSADVDGVSGATVTSTAIKEAAASCFAQAKGEAVEANEEAAAEETATTEEAAATEEEAAATEEEAAATEESAVIEVVPAADGTYVAGTYTASAQGIESEVTVTMVFTDNMLQMIDIDVSGETPTVGGAIGLEMEKAIITAQSADVDGVSGATVTSTAILQAAAECFNEAMGTEVTAETATITAEPMAAHRDGIDYVTVDAPEAANENGVVTAEEWSTVFPEIYASYEANSDNSYTVSYLEEDPYLVNIYEGYGFAKDYNSAEGHTYCLEDVANTARPHALANCLTCKTADYTALVNALGESAYSLTFDEAYAQSHENVGCYNCHANEAGNEGELVATHDYTVEKLSDDGIDPDTLSCGQCHIEYYFKPDTKATTTPYDSVEGMSPDAILEYYNSIDFADWTQESTGAKLLKAQHPEMETVLGEGSVHSKLGLTCADCHMATETSSDGTTYVSHKLESPLDNENLLATCATCHGDTDMAEKVHTLQSEITARETVVGNELSDLKDALAEANSSGKYSEDELNTLRDLYRSAQWYFDFDYVENSEGAHNSTMANYCLDTAENYINQANALFR